MGSDRFDLCPAFCKQFFFSNVWVFKFLKIDVNGKLVRIPCVVYHDEYQTCIAIAMDSRCFEGNVCIDVLELNT